MLATFALLFCCSLLFAAQETVSIQAGRAERFRATYESSERARAAVIVMAAGTPGAALRRELPARGYAVLADLPPGAAASSQLSAAIVFLREKGHQKIAIAAHGEEAKSVNTYITQTAHGIAAWVCISITGGRFDDRGKLEVPTLDLFAEHDPREIVDLADARAAVLRRIRGSAQIEIAGAEPGYPGREAEVVAAVGRFLDEKLR